MKFNSIAVLGSNSFAGSTFVANALKRGCKVIGFNRSKENEDLFLAYKLLDERKNYKFIQADLNLDFDIITSELEKFTSMLNEVKAAMTQLQERGKEFDSTIDTKIATFKESSDETFEEQNNINREIEKKRQESLERYKRDIDNSLDAYAEIMSDIITKLGALNEEKGGRR